MATTRWVSHVLVVRFDDTQGQAIIGQHPPPLPLPDTGPDVDSDSSLSLGEQSDIAKLAMPDCLPSTAAHSFNFAFRIRDKTEESSSPPHLHRHCFVAFRQHRDPSSVRGYFQQSVVLVSRLPCLGLFYQTLDRLAEVLESEGIAQYHHSLLVAFQHFSQWLPPATASREGPHLKMPFFGSVFTYHSPSLPNYSVLNRSSGAVVHCNGLDGGQGTYSDTSLQRLSSFGLLPHLWTMWHLLVTGRNILVYSPSAEVCSLVVTTLCSLTAPLAFAGDCRPYISAAESDVTDLGADESSRRCRIVGCTNPFLLRAFKSYDAAVFLPGEAASSFEVEARKSSVSVKGAAGFFARALSLTGTAASLPASSHASSPASLTGTARIKVLSARSLEEEFDRWMLRSSSGSTSGPLSISALGSSIAGSLAGSRSKSRGRRETLVCLRASPPLAPDADVLRRLQSVLAMGMSGGAGQAETIGNMLLREHFRALNMALLRPLEPLLIATPAAAADAEGPIDATGLVGCYTSCHSSLKGGVGGRRDTVVLPPCLCVADWQAILLGFAHSPHFQAWARWKQHHSAGVD